MIEVVCIEESTPTTALAQELRKHRDAMQRNQWGVVMRVVPRPTHDFAPPVSANAFYDLRWAIPVLCHHQKDEGKGDHPSCDQGWTIADEHYLHDVMMDIHTVGVLPAPPVIPVEDRLAAVPPVTDQDVADVERRQPGSTALFGGQDAVRKWLRDGREQAVRNDRTAASFDWPVQANRIVEIYKASTPPKLTKRQRIMTAGARLYRAEQEVAAAKQSARDLIRNADAANYGAGNKAEGTPTEWATWTGLSRPTVYRWIDQTDTEEAQ